MKRKKSKDTKKNGTLLQLSDEPTYFKFYNTPSTRIKNIPTQEKLVQYLSKAAKVGVKERSNWVFQSSSKWIKTLFSELSAPQKEKVHKVYANMQKKEFGSKAQDSWTDGVNVATVVLDVWFEGKTLEEVILKAQSFHHDELLEGFLIQGEYVQKQLSKREATDIHSLKEKLTKLVPEQRLQAFRISKQNPFFTEDEDRVRTISGLHCFPYVGSLNTVYNFEADTVETLKPTEELASFHAVLSKALTLKNIDEEQDYVDTGLHLNLDFYYIWKFRNYCTAYHQDIHTFPHITIYNQLSGVSVFHFLPLLVGLFITYSGRHFPESIAKNLNYLDQQGIGHVANLCEGDVIIILPYGSHGVWVPTVDKNKNTHLKQFEVSSIRAAEVFISALQASLYKEFEQNSYDPFSALKE